MLRRSEPTKTTIRGQYFVLCWPHSEKQSLRFTSVQKGSTAQLDSQNRKFDPVLIITEAKMLISLCANELGLSIRGSEIL